MLVMKYPSVETEDGIVFFLPRNKRKIKISKEEKENLRKILLLCDGYHDTGSIVKETGLDEDAVKSTLQTLRQADILGDATEQYLTLHECTKYPSPFNKDLPHKEMIDYMNASPKLTTPKEKISSRYKADTKINLELFWTIENRRSARQFENIKVSLRDALILCHYSYSRAIHAVPSGGALYPLKLFVLFPKNIQESDGGYFEYDPINDELCKIDTEPDIEKLRFCFNMEEIGLGSWCQIVICADLMRHGGKYANRGYRLTLIECGQVAENISLCCEQLGLASCEFGGILEEPLKEELLITNPNIDPILAIGIGYPKRNQDGSVVRYEKPTIPSFEEYVGENGLVRYAGVQTFDGCNSFFGFAKTSDGESTGAVDVCSHTAKNKAIVEAIERYISMHSTDDIVSSVFNMKIRGFDYIDIRKSGLTLKRNFTDASPIRWKRGYQLSDRSHAVYVPSDMVYYGHDNNLCCNNSSGIAAHTDKEAAIKLAVGELIERDAIMRFWRSHAAYKMGCSTLPTHAKKRIEFWNKKGRELSFIRLPSVRGVTVLAYIRSAEYPCFVCGAAMVYSADDIDKAIYKALNECEYAEFAGMEFPKKAPAIADIRRPSDHGDYYKKRENAEKLSWLSNIEEPETEILTNEFENIGKEIIIVEMSETPLHVVRAFSNRLIPITFGNVAENQEPHFFA